MNNIEWYHPQMWLWLWFKVSGRSLWNATFNGIYFGIYASIMYKLFPVCQITSEPIQGFPSNSIKFQFFSNILWSIVSKALERSRNTAITDSFSSRQVAVSVTNFVIASIVLYCFSKLIKVEWNAFMQYFL